MPSFGPTIRTVRARSGRALSQETINKPVATRGETQFARLEWIRVVSYEGGFPAETPGEFDGRRPVGYCPAVLSGEERSEIFVPPPVDRR